MQQITCHRRRPILSNIPNRAEPHSRAGAYGEAPCQHFNSFNRPDEDRYLAVWVFLNTTETAFGRFCRNPLWHKCFLRGGDGVRRGPPVLPFQQEGENREGKGNLLLHIGASAGWGPADAPHTLTRIGSLVQFRPRRRRRPSSSIVPPTASSVIVVGSGMTTFPTASRASIRP